MTDDPLLGQQLGNFRLERILGRGGMGQVYYGWDVKLQRPVAIKVIDFRFRNNPAYAKRFVREAQAVASWRHENIAQVYHADEQGDLYYFALEYIDGLDLGQLLSSYAARGELMPQVYVLRIGRALASALDYAHSKNVIHRDVKPSNVIVARDEHVVLTDFGLALDLQQGSVGEVFGSAHYIAPEQARRSSDAIAQSDLYSLGIMLYEMLTGVVPFDDPSPTAVALQHITQPPPAPRSLNPNLNLHTEEVLLKALSKSPQDRYQTGQELITALDEALQAAKTATNLTPLPPLPAGVQPRTPAAVSQLRVNEVIGSQASLASSPVAVPSQTKLPSREKPPVERQLAKPPRQSVSWLALGGCIFALLVALVLMGLWFAGPLRNLFQVGANIQSTESPVNLTDASQPANVIVTGEATPSAAETSISATQVSGAPPTVKYPDGKHFRLLYDNNSLYFLNLSTSNVPVNWVAFERLSDSDQPLNRFNGTRWAEYYATSLPDRCMALRILGSPAYLDPPECGNNNFLSLRTPTRNDATVFWTAQEGSRQFRVLWRAGGVDEEVARCEIGAGTCEVFFP